MESQELSINDFLKSLEEMDEALAKNDVNAVTKKVHECIAKIKATEYCTRVFKIDDEKLEN